MRKSLSILALALAIFGCDDDDSGEGGGGSPSYSAEATLRSATLATAGLVRSDAACPSGSTCITPSDLSGRVMSVGFSAGVLGEQAGYLINPIGPTDPSSAVAGSGTESFSLSDATVLRGSHVCCGGTSYPEGEVVARQFEISFDYIDTSFTIASGDLAGSHTIRVVYSNTTFEDGVAATRGDKMYKTDQGFRFCTSSSCGEVTRPASPLTDETAATRTGANPNYAYFFARVSDPFSFTREEALEGDWSFSLDFSMTNGAEFSVDPATLSSVADLVDAFSIYSKPGDEDSGSSGFSVAASKSKM